jgi:hypothetical protein
MYGYPPGSAADRADPHGEPSAARKRPWDPWTPDGAEARRRRVLAHLAMALNLRDPAMARTLGGTCTRCPCPRAAVPS